jgi:anti-anti-sigma factor
LRFNIARDPTAIVVTLFGDLDVFAAVDARAHLDEAINRGVAHSVAVVIVDTAGLGFCDSTGLSVLVRAHDDAQRRGVRLGLRNLAPPLRNLLEITGLCQLLNPDG